MMNTIEQLQQWYKSQCNGDWEHAYGIRIETLDNPGWKVTIDLIGTVLEHRPFPATEHGFGPDSNPVGEDWHVCRVDKGFFQAACGPHHLERTLKTFLEWAQ
jgi:hypothetical protein